MLRISEATEEAIRRVRQQLQEPQRDSRSESPEKTYCIVVQERRCGGSHGVVRPEARLRELLDRALLLVPRRADEDPHTKGTNMLSACSNDARH